MSSLPNNNRNLLQGIISNDKDIASLLQTNILNSKFSNALQNKYVNPQNTVFLNQFKNDPLLTNIQLQNYYKVNEDPLQKEILSQLLKNQQQFSSAQGVHDLQLQEALFQPQVNLGTAAASQLQLPAGSQIAFLPNYLQGLDNSYLSTLAAQPQFANQLSTNQLFNLNQPQLFIQDQAANLLQQQQSIQKLLQQYQLQQQQQTSPTVQNTNLLQQNNSLQNLFNLSNSQQNNLNSIQQQQQQHQQQQLLLQQQQQQQQQQQYLLNQLMNQSQQQQLLQQFQQQVMQQSQQQQTQQPQQTQQQSQNLNQNSIFNQIFNMKNNTAASINQTLNLGNTPILTSNVTNNNVNLNNIYDNSNKQSNLQQIQNKNKALIMHNKDFCSICFTELAQFSPKQQVGILDNPLIRCVNINCQKTYHAYCLDMNDNDIRAEKAQFQCPFCTINCNDPLNEIQQALVENWLVVSNDVQKFALDAETISKIQNEQKLAIEVRCLKIDGKSYDHCWIDSGEVVLNGKTMQEFFPLPKNSSLSKRKDQKLLIKDNLVVGINSIYFAEHKIPENQKQNYKLSSNALYLAGVYIVRQLDTQNLVEKIKKNNIKTEQECKQEIMAEFNKDISSDLQIDKISVSLQDIFDFCMLKTPAKGRFCQHLQCFSLENMIATCSMMNPRKWKCPLCKKKSFEFVINNLQWEILKKLASDKQTSNEISFFRNGNFEIQKKSIDAENRSQSSQLSDNESEKALQEELNNEEKQVNAKKKPQNDKQLILIDDEEIIMIDNQQQNKSSANITLQGGFNNNNANFNDQQGGINSQSIVANNGNIQFNQQQLNSNLPKSNQQLNQSLTSQQNQAQNAINIYFQQNIVTLNNQNNQNQNISQKSNNEKSDLNNATQTNNNAKLTSYNPDEQEQQIRAAQGLNTNKTDQQKQVNSGNQQMQLLQQQQKVGEKTKKIKKPKTKEEKALRREKKRLKKEQQMLIQQQLQQSQLLQQQQFQQLQQSQQQQQQ